MSSQCFQDLNVPIGEQMCLKAYGPGNPLIDCKPIPADGEVCFDFDEAAIAWHAVSINATNESPPSANVVFVPEPGTNLSLLVGVLVLAMIGRIRRG